MSSDLIVVALAASLFALSLLAGGLVLMMRDIGHIVESLAYRRVMPRGRGALRGVLLLWMVTGGILAWSLLRLRG